MVTATIGSLAFTGCKQRSKVEDHPAPPTSGALAGSSSAEPPAAEPKAQAFCEKAMRKALECLNDDGFWDVFATTFLAKYPDPSGNPDSKRAWIGMRKDDIAGLAKDGQVQQNCSVMVRLNRLPTEADMKPVVDAMGKSCTDFGTAMGFLLFHKGVFHLPR
ncbi:hypothetical protein BH11MYX3_BH11MYX3_16060 [soil metagenome]